MCPEIAIINHFDFTIIAILTLIVIIFIDAESLEDIGTAAIGQLFIIVLCWGTPVQWSLVDIQRPVPQENVS